MFKGVNEKVKKLSLVDLKLIKLAVFFATILIVKIFPKLLEINARLLIILVIVCAIKPFYTFWIKKVSP